MNKKEINTPFEAVVQVDIDGKKIDYLLFVDVIGHVHEARAMIYELPEMSRKLIMGTDNGELDRKIQAHCGLFRYIVPLVLAGRLPSYHESLSGLALEINKRLSIQNLKWDELLDCAAENTIAYDAIVALGNHSSDESKMRTLWEDIEFIIENKSEGNLYDKLRNVGYYHQNTVVTFFSHIIPFLNHNSQRVAFEYFENRKSNEIKKYLINELNEAYSAPYASGIIKGMKSYDSQDVDVYDAVIGFYEKTENITEDSLANICEILMKFNTAKSIEIGFEILKLNKRYSAGYAARLLYEHLEDKGEVAKIILPLFKKADPKESEAAFSILSNSKMYKYLPGPNELLEIYVKTMEKGQNLNITYAMPTLAEYTGAIGLKDEIYDYLSHESSAVKEGILILISCCCLKPKVPNFLTSRFIKKYISLIKDADQDVRRNAMQMLGKGGNAYGSREYIPLLLDVIYSRPKDTLTILAAMRNINQILDSFPYDSSINDYYLEALKESNYNYRVAALTGLWFSPDKELKNSLLKYENDPSEDVRQSLKFLISNDHAGSPRNNKDVILKSEKIMKSYNSNKAKIPPEKSGIFDKIYKYLFN